MQKIFCDDDFTFVNLVYADEQKKVTDKITETLFLAGN